MRSYCSPIRAANIKNFEKKIEKKNEIVPLNIS